ncbi:hypothetical protein HDA40_000885 [Hamadaea flava]|uniref:Uncharacterized protein n=1 Tax=Hamadaea flava TaxID=1742688 RepID=A0ABV8LRC4_9ACTN|nr:hypothetical protein [Hamadaea flava]MCP2322378.1 hypothetical protein [Hamadaea flava]
MRHDLAGPGLTTPSPVGVRRRTRVADDSLRQISVAATGGARMQPNPPQLGFPQQGQPQLRGGPSPLSGKPRPRANAVAAMIAASLALLAAAMLCWFALHDVVYALGSTDRWSSLVLQNVIGGVGGAGALVVLAGFTFARMIPGAWTLCGLCVLYVVVTLVVSPLLRGIAVSDQFTFVFGFERSNGIAIALAVIFSVLTAVTAAVAGTVKSYGPTSAGPRP